MNRTKLLILLIALHISEFESRMIKLTKLDLENKCWAKQHGCKELYSNTNIKSEYFEEFTHGLLELKPHPRRNDAFSDDDLLSSISGSVELSDNLLLESPDTLFRRLAMPELQMEGRPSPTLPCDACGLCPVVDIEPCNCTNNGGFLGGSISMDCPSSISTYDEIQDIIVRTEWFTYNVSRFSLTHSNITGALNIDVLSPLTVSDLVLDYDQFLSVDNYAFNSSASSLRSISIQDNQLTYFHFDDLKNIPNLMSLDLSGNKLNYIPTDAFVSAGLVELDLSYNIINNVDDMAFSGLKNVEEINLAGNRLSWLKKNLFYIEDRNTNNVLQIDISYNHVSNIDSTTFKDLKYVNVNLMSNELASVEEMVFKEVIMNSAYLSSIMVDENPIVCDCGVAWIVRDPLMTECFDNFHCHDQNRTLYELDPEDYKDC